MAFRKACFFAINSIRNIFGRIFRTLGAVADFGEQSGHERRAERKRHSNATRPEHDPQPELAHRRHVCADGRWPSRRDRMADHKHQTVFGAHFSEIIHCVRMENIKQHNTK